MIIYGENQERQCTEGETVYLVIENTGVGIRKNDLPRVFEQYFTGYRGRFDQKPTGVVLHSR